MTGFLFFYFSTKAAGVNSGRNSPALNESPDKDKKNWSHSDTQSIWKVTHEPVTAELHLILWILKREDKGDTINFLGDVTGESLLAAAALKFYDSPA